MSGTAMLEGAFSRGRPPAPQVPDGWRATWLPHDRQYSYLHIASEYVQFGFPDEQTIAKYASQNGRSSTTSPASQFQSPALPTVRSSGLLGSVLSNAPGGSSGVNNGDSGNITGANILARFDVPGNWSGKGQHVEFTRHESIPLEEGISLGRGASADVHEVTCRGVKIARKQIFCSRRMKIEDVKRELEILRKLDHKHVVTLIGSYTQSRVLGLLLFPAAVCDLGVYLDELDEEQRAGNGTIGEPMARLCERLGIYPSIYLAREKLNSIYGCLANAVQYLHDNDVRHKDLKPRNILLDRSDGLFVTDFGLSRDTTDASTSVTNGIERGTYKYCAPEVARYEPRGRAADIYSLGCVFLEVNTVYRQLSLVEFDIFRTENEDHSFQNSPAKLKEWMAKLRAVPGPLRQEQGIFDLMDLVGTMIADAPTERPLISKVISTLKLLGREAYFGSCCPVPSDLQQRYNELTFKYRKVKGLYFERAAENEQLQNALTNEMAKVTQLESKREPDRQQAIFAERTRNPYHTPQRLPQSVTDWAITPTEKQNFDAIFVDLDMDMKGHITGEEAVPFFSKSKLPEDTLAHIWDLADINSEGTLTADKFAVAMYFIRQQNSKSEEEREALPERLPANLVPPSLRRGNEVYDEMGGRK